MKRSSKTFRVIGALFALANLVAAFLPLTIREQINYPTQSVNAFTYIKSLLVERILPFSEVSMTNDQILFISACICIPLVLAIFTGIFGIFGDYKQVISIICSVIMMILFIGAFIKTDLLLPQAAELDVTYQKGVAGVVFVALSAISALAGIIGFIRTPRMSEDVKKYSEIPGVRETKEEQIKAKYSMIIDDDNDSSIPIPSQPMPALQRETIGAVDKSMTIIKPFIPAPPRGVLVGVRGIYEGAEIPMKDGETISFGRSVENDLVFTDQNSISRNHCRITWNQKTGTYLFLDYSCNGSFVYGSTDCLPSNIEIEIQAGTAIEIGNESNVFRLS